MNTPSDIFSYVLAVLDELPDDTALTAAELRFLGYQFTGVVDVIEAGMRLVILRHGRRA